MTAHQSDRILELERELKQARAVAQMLVNEPTNYMINKLTANVEWLITAEQHEASTGDQLRKLFWRR